MFLQVILRYGFNVALTWTEELSGFAMVWAVYMGAALAVRERFHVRIMAGVVALPRSLALALVVLADADMAGLQPVHDPASASNTWRVVWAQPSISPSLGINMFWPESIVLIGFVLMTLRLLQIYVRWFATDRRELPGVSAEYQTNLRP